MASKNLIAGLIGTFLCLGSLHSGVDAHHAASLLPFLGAETHRSLSSLAALPHNCTAGLEQRILAEELKAGLRFLDCNFYTLGIEVAEIVVDTVFFAFEVYSNGPLLPADVKEIRQCFEETGVQNIALCLLGTVPGTIVALRNVVAGTENYIGEMKMIIPLLVDSIKECRNSAVHDYRHFLNGVVEKAKIC